MFKKIVRGSVIGIFLGVSLGICISYAVRFKELADKRNDTYMVLNNQSKDVIEISDDIGQYGEFCDDLQDVILRFHVKANSNSDEDLSLKYSVRDAILYEYGNILQSDMTREEVINYLENELDHIKDVAVRTISNLGYNYDVNVYISKDYFPIRQYGEMVFPAGYYDALRVDIGAAQGENFWCILYPMMCYPLDTGAVLSKEDEEIMQEILSEEDYDKLFIKRDVKESEVKIKFKFLEWLGL